jgi:hypothetical protein
MLAPDLNATLDDLAGAFSTIKRVDAFAYASMNTQIGVLSPDPDWLGSVRKELELLSAAGAQWQQDKPSVLAPTLTAFSHYSTLFPAISDAIQASRNDSSAVVDLLDQLSITLGNARESALAAERLFAQRVGLLNNIQQVFSTSIDKAWGALAKEEDQMIELAVQVTRLQDRLNSLQESINSAEIDSGKAYVQSSLSIYYTLAIAGGDIPYLTIAGLVYTVGKLAYDVIVTDQQIKDTIRKIVETRIQMSEAAQAAAFSKAIIQLIDHFDKALLAVERKMPPFSQMWADQQRSVEAMQDDIRAGIKPGSMFNIRTMPIAAEAWRKIAEFARKLPLTIQQGKPIILSTSPETTPKLMEATR